MDRQRVPPSTFIEAIRQHNVKWVRSHLLDTPEAANAPLLPNGVTPLMLAAKYGATSIMWRLRRAGAQPDAQARHGETALSMAAEFNQVLALQALKRMGVDIRCDLGNGQCALHAAARNNATQAISWLVRHGIPVDQQDPEGNTPLHLAARFGNLAAIRVLLELQGNPSIPNHKGMDAIDTAREAGQEVASRLLERFILRHTESMEAAP